MPHVSPSRPAIALRWLGAARRAMLAALGVLLIASELESDLHVHPIGLLVTMGGVAFLEVVETLWLRRQPHPAPWTVGAHGAVDLLSLSAFLLWSGGAQNPMAHFTLVYVAVLAVVLPRVQAWIASVSAMVLEAAVVLGAPVIPGFGLEAFQHPLERVAHVLSFIIAAVAITFLLSNLAHALGQRDKVELETSRRLAEAERLADVGAVAAGAAHALATPLGTIQLLNEELRVAEGELRTRSADDLQFQVHRCREILDGLRRAGGTAQDERPGPASASTLEPADWVREWAQAHPEVHVSTSGVEAFHAPGTTAEWRTALWVLLDNALRAGSHELDIRTIQDGTVMVIRVDDDGKGLDGDAVTRAGEPLWSSWGGTGLGLYAVRRHARALGGDALLEPRAEGGARATLRIPTASGTGRQP